jgi:pyruvate formate lyase activating enzyme
MSDLFDSPISPYSLEILPDGHRCTLCPLECELSNGETGKCNVRVGTEVGIVFTGYGKITNIAIEPIEKRPLFHFMPGCKFLSAGGYGCSMSCDFCQNWKVSQSTDAKTKDVSPLQLVTMAKDRGAAGICLTYNEPTVYAEYVLELGKLMKFMKMPLALKTNAYLHEGPWKEICRVVSAMNIDHKGSDRRYGEAGVLPGAEALVLERIKQAKELGVHVEISLPVHHDDIADRFGYLRLSLWGIDYNIPIHLLRIFPAYKSTADTTSNSVVRDVYEFMKESMNYVYTSTKTDTICRNCGITKVVRKGLTVSAGESSTPNCVECNRLDAQMPIKPL